MFHGQIVDARVGLVQIQLISSQVGHHHEATTTSGATTSGATTSGATTTVTTNAAGSGGTAAPTAPGGSSQRHHGDEANGRQEWDWKWPVVGLAVVGSFGIVGAILFFCWPQAPPPKPNPGPPPKPQVISVTTNEETTVNNGGLATRPTDTHYTHVTHVHHHHHAHH